MFREFSIRKSNDKNAKAVLSLVASDEKQPSEVELKALALKRAADAERLELKSRLHNRLLDTLNLAVLDKIEEEDLRTEIGKMVAVTLREEGRALRSEDLRALVDELMHEVLGLGPL